MAYRRLIPIAFNLELSNGFGACSVLQRISVEHQNFCINRRNLHATNDGKENIILLGSPGCGKTTVGKILASKLGKSVIDIDDDHLEKYWGMPVSQKLDVVGSDKFVEEEGKALLHFEASDAIVSLTGSNPMYKEAMDHISKSGTVVFLDVHMQDILERLERMKVNRIVGQNDGTSMADILQYRQQFYEDAYDIRVICERNEQPETIADKVIKQVNRLNDTSTDSFVSTRGCRQCPSENDGANVTSRNDDGTTFNGVRNNGTTFTAAILKGQAPDGGLYVPEASLPTMSLGELSRLVDMPYIERGIRILEKLIHPRSLHPSRLKTFIRNAYAESSFGSDVVFPLRTFQPPGGAATGRQYLVELFHGPTASFKDAALQLMPQLFSYALEKSTDTHKYIILVATSGDTGGAVMDGFARQSWRSDIGVLVIYPQEGISDIQRQQMSAMNQGNSKAVGIAGADFDFCQRVVKDIFRDKKLTQKLEKNYNMKLSAANSINWGRLLPQVVYHVSTYLELVRAGSVDLGQEVNLCVPTGNFGNILSAYYAQCLGIPYKKLICASNENNVLTEFIQTGTYDVSGRRLLVTTSPAIDILVSSNLERFLYHISHGDTELVASCMRSLQQTRRFSVPNDILQRVQAILSADWCTEEECRSTIRSTLATNGYLLDTHTAVGKTIADRIADDTPMVIASTAHPGKFAPDILRFLDISPDQMTSSDMTDKLTELANQPGPHSNLHACLGRQDVQFYSCAKTYDAVIEEIVSLADTL